MLRTSSELIRYDAQATDGRIGTVKDLLFDDQSRQVRFLVIDTGGFLIQHQVLIDPRNVCDLKFPEETLLFNLGKHEIE